MEEIILECPHCKGIIIVEPKQINCAIFRHGTLKINGAQVNPHAPKSECDRLIARNLVNGCCKPFKMVRYRKNALYAPDSTPATDLSATTATTSELTITDVSNNKWIAIACDYI